MRAQIKPIIDLLGDIVEVDYIDGGERSAPYQGIETVFPKESYYAWYQEPTRDALQAAHTRVAAQLCSGLVESFKPHSAAMPSNSVDPRQFHFGASSLLDTPPSSNTATPPIGFLPHRSLSSASSAVGLKYDWYRNGHGTIRRASDVAVSFSGSDTPVSCPNTAGIRTPLLSESGTYDGLICFSQGCAVSTGLLLEMQQNRTQAGQLSLRLIILICGGRPFGPDGSMERVEPASVSPIAIRSVHVQGRKDAGVEESKRLAHLYTDAGREVLELDIGHCPPRRSTDVELVAASIRRSISEMS
ncbi:FSH1 domain-containing protein [Pseudozyma hubeiensis]|nr:FSH1 domain-containing protein [Pseudozyma hubeiensis]